MELNQDQKEMEDFTDNKDEFLEFFLEKHKVYVVNDNCKVKILKGEVACHGSVLKDGDSCEIFVKKQNPKFLLENLSDESLVDGKSSLHSSRILIKSDSDNPISEYNDSEETEDENIRILSYSEKNQEKIQKIENLLEICRNHKSKLKVLLVAGARKTGKTTLSHFITNRLLQTKSSRVYYIETDLGQPCYSPPGFISLFQVKQPLICNKSGWNLSYLNYKKLEFIGDNSPQFYPEIYKENLEKIKSELDQIDQDMEGGEEGYVVINTHGFTQGVGYFLTKSVLEVFEPSVVAYVASDKSGNDYCLMEKIRVVKGRRLNEVRNKLFPGNILPFVRFEELVPKSVKNRSRMVKRSRETTFIRFFENFCQRKKFDLDDVVFYINENDKHVKVFKREKRGKKKGSFYLRKRSFDSFVSENFEDRNRKSDANLEKLFYIDLSLIFIKSIAQISTGNENHICLIEDFDIKDKKITLILPQTFNPSVPSSKTQIKITKSPFMTLNSNLLHHSNDYDAELSLNHRIGEKLFWIGANNIGIGEKPAKKILSLRKKLLKG